MNYEYAIFPLDRDYEELCEQFFNCEEFQPAGIYAQNYYVTNLFSALGGVYSSTGMIKSLSKRENNVIKDMIERNPEEAEYIKLCDRSFDLLVALSKSTDEQEIQNIIKELKEIGTAFSA